MGRSRQGQHAQWDQLTLKLAIKAILVDRKPKKRVAKEFGIPRQTLQDYVKRVQTDGCGVEKMQAGRPTTLTDDQESELVEVLISMADRLFGLSPKVVRQLVYTFCETNGIVHRFSTTDKAAGKEWLSGFLRRHPELSVRVAEATSMQRAAGFNKPKVDRFYDELEKIISITVAFSAYRHQTSSTSMSLALQSAISQEK